MKTASAPRPIDVVIPVWNDADALSRSLPHLLQEWPADALRVVDGGSRDGSVEVAKQYGVRLLEMAVASRSSQMNAGAAAGGGDIVLFLHADTRLPPNAGRSIAEAISNGAIGGAFARRFDNRSLFLRFTCLTADWRGRWFGTFFGDQAIFATRQGFRKVGGFPDQPLFEDFEFSRRLSKLGRTVLLRPPVVSSGRRFERRGAVLQTVADFALTVRYVRRGKAILLREHETIDA